MIPDANKKYSFAFHNDIKNEKNKVRKSANPQNLKDEIMNNKEIKDLFNKYEMLFYHILISILFLFSSLSLRFFCLDNLFLFNLDLIIFFFLFLDYFIYHYLF